MAKKYLRIIGIVLLLTFIIMQFFRVDRSVPETDPENDFIQMTQAPDDIVNILESACYDCHSYKTTYPWYSQIAPVSWWLQDHIDHGRDEMNFSKWGTYENDRTDHKLEECIELIEEGEMPLNSYTWVHSGARLSEEEKTQLTDWFAEQRVKMQRRNIGLVE